MKFVIALAALAAFASPALAAPCAPEAKVRLDIAAWQEPVRVIKLEGIELAVFLYAYNRLPPASHFAADKILIIENKAKSNALMVMFANDCAMVTVAVPNSTLRKLLISI